VRDDPTFAMVRLRPLRSSLHDDDHAREPAKQEAPERLGVVTEAQQKLNLQKAKEQKQKEVSCLHSCHNL
jgi:hypothetical protein